MGRAAEHHLLHQHCGGQHQRALGLPRTLCSRLPPPARPLILPARHRWQVSKNVVDALVAAASGLGVVNTVLEAFTHIQTVSEASGYKVVSVLPLLGELPVGGLC